MGRRLLLGLWIALLLGMMAAVANGQASRAAQEGGAASPAKEDIITLMVMVGRMPPVEQNRRMDFIWDNLGRGETPRSDFLFCMGFAYLGNYKAQACLGNAYASGRGTQRDIAEAYVWYAIALDNPINDAANKKKIQSDRDRIRKELSSAVPAQTEKELEDRVKAQKELKRECLAEVRDTRP